MDQFANGIGRNLKDWVFTKLAGGQSWFQLSFESNSRLFWFYFATLCDWSKKTRPIFSTNENPKPIVIWSHAFSRALH